MILPELRLKPLLTVIQGSLQLDAKSASSWEYYGLDDIPSLEINSDKDHKLHLCDTRATKHEHAMHL